MRTSDTTKSSDSVQDSRSVEAKMTLVSRWRGVRIEIVGRGSEKNVTKEKFLERLAREFSLFLHSDT